MHGWRTGAIIKELTVMFPSTSMFRYLINNFNMLLLVFYSQKFKRLTNLNLNGTLIGFKFYNSWSRNFRKPRASLRVKLLGNGLLNVINSGKMLYGPKETSKLVYLALFTEIITFCFLFYLFFITGKIQNMCSTNSLVACFEHTITPLISLGVFSALLTFTRQTWLISCASLPNTRSTLDEAHCRTNIVLGSSEDKIEALFWLTEQNLFRTHTMMLVTCLLLLPFCCLEMRIYCSPSKGSLM